jgi:antitoxin ParD1/3/4
MRTTPGYLLEQDETLRCEQAHQESPRHFSIVKPCQSRYDSFSDGNSFEERSMPTRNVNLTDELDRFVLAKVESGRFENASEVVRAALRTLEREELRHEVKLAALKKAIDEGDASGAADGNSFLRVRQALKLSRKKR